MSFLSELLNNMLHPHDAMQRHRHSEKSRQLDNVIKDVHDESCKLRDTISTMVNEMKGDKKRDEHHQ